MASSASVIAGARTSRVSAFIQRVRSGDAIAQGVVFLAAALIVAITALLVFELWVNSGQARHTFGWNFLVTSTWDPVAGQFGALPFVFGTVVTSALALLIAVPIGVGAAIFLSEL